MAQSFHPQGHFGPFRGPDEQYVPLHLIVVDSWAPSPNPQRQFHAAPFCQPQEHWPLPLTLSDSLTSPLIPRDNLAHSPKPNEQIGLFP